MVDLNSLLLVGLCVGGGIVSTIIIGLLTIILIQIKKEVDKEEEESFGIPLALGGGRPGMVSLYDLQRAAAGAAGQVAAEKAKEEKPEAAGGTYI